MEKYGYDFEDEAETIKNKSNKNRKSNKSNNLVKTSEEITDYLTEGLHDIVEEKGRLK